MGIFKVNGYVPTKWLGIVAVISFAVSGIINILQIIKYRNRASIISFIGTTGEVIAWIARLYSSSHSNDTSLVSAGLQSAMIMDFPVFYTAQLYTAIKHLITQYGANVDILGSTFYGLAFIICDIISLLIQFAGGNIAIGANENSRKERIGSTIMLLGICLQLVTVFTFAGCSLDYWYNHHYSKSYGDLT
ncbi:hypothetical protein SJAG_02943 [Schizosaccharomyces japonicus yFS275]|uniref:Uncharacterized protein n=1 Tax=Schizosaccharomyces japonicus (strain yFS275 / FY16936) TaxID=402676 RepID=B6K2W9_SCHJY|nr:hypothetical protein SJAG_02943 [Schizosaccharomyces japonicus yFS275]EEB07826.1 hypothetical protein SJAG_02943 [Schizosaccharomyces japonicus yFS275]